MTSLKNKFRIKQKVKVPHNLGQWGDWGWGVMKQNSEMSITSYNNDFYIFKQEIRTWPN